MKFNDSCYSRDWRLQSKLGLISIPFHHSSMWCDFWKIPSPGLWDPFQLLDSVWWTDSFEQIDDNEVLPSALSEWLLPYLWFLVPWKLIWMDCPNVLLGLQHFWLGWSIWGISRRSRSRRRVGLGYLWLLQGNKLCHPKIYLSQVDYCKLKTIKAQKTKKDILTLPLIA